MSLAITVLVLLALGYLAAPLLAWVACLVVVFWTGDVHPAAWLVCIPLGVLVSRPLRVRMISGPLMRVLSRSGFLPTISPTEEQALQAGTVWLEGELFSGKPRWRRILAEPYPQLSERERNLLEGPVEAICQMTDDWQVYRSGDLPSHVWDAIKQHRLLGMIIPEEHGGLGLSANACGAIISRLASRSQALAITVMVPNSLGPAELLLHYGTDEQRARYLPRLASGEEIPCFALTEPGAGSDAAAIQARGVVFRGTDERPWIRMDWQKRYTTLAGVSTVIGLAFKLSDPENLLGQGVEPGITCALVPSDTAGVTRDLRHDPMGIPFWNCPNEGKGVELPADCIIGGPERAGDGWRMLMECLSAGRGVSLPSASAGGVQAVALIASAHAVVRKQFGLSIGRFEGIHEPLARIGGAAYTLEAARRFLAGGLDGGAKPAVASAILKEQSTETLRDVVSDGMDVLAGNAISRGPRNLMERAYMGAPIGITVEGANILTRTLIVFGQGSVRCHPFVQDEIRALANEDADGFDRALAGHVRHGVRNAFRAALLLLTRGWLARTPVGTAGRRYVRRLTTASAIFAFFTEVALGGLGGALRRKGRLTGRFADALSGMFMATATLSRFEAEGRRTDDLAIFRWSMETNLHRVQVALEGLLRELDVPVARWFLCPPALVALRLLPVGRPPSDQLGSEVAMALQSPGETRDRWTAAVYRPTDETDPLARLERAMSLAVTAEMTLGRIRDAIRRKELPTQRPEELLDEAVKAGVIGAAEADQVRSAQEACSDAIQVDAFTQEHYLRLRGALEKDPS